MIKFIALALTLFMSISCTKEMNSIEGEPVFIIPENYRGPIFLADDKGKKGQILNGVLVVVYSHYRAYREKKYGSINFKIANKSALLARRPVAALYLNKQYDPAEIALWEGSITKFGAGSEDIIKKLGYGETFFMFYYGTAKDAEEFFLNENSNKKNALHKLAGQINKKTEN